MDIIRNILWIEMNNRFFVRFYFFLSLLFWSILFGIIKTNGQSNLRIENLRCDNLKNPVGLDNKKPAFSWELLSLDKDRKQTSYQILIASDSFKLSNNEGDVWSSGKVKSRKTNHVLFGGKTLASEHYYFWKVRVWDENNKVSDWSPVQYWAMGLLDNTDWVGKWIGVDSLFPVSDYDKYTVPPSPLLRKEFTISKKVKRATLYATALGVYESYINGKKVGDHILAPEWTDYDKRVMYQTYDATNLIMPGTNAIGAILADGWYAGDLWDHFYRGRYGYYRKFLAQLRLEYTDGTSEIIKTDDSWKVYKNGPVREASIFDGEIFDQRANPTGWMLTGFDDSLWDKVTVYHNVHITLNAQANEPIKIVREIKPVSIFRLTKFKYKRNTYIIDMGQNIAGWIRLNLPYNPGRKLTIRYAEMLNDDSTLYVANLRNAKATDVYFPDREDSIYYEPRFTYHGFRYVEITGLSKLPDVSEITGKVMASATDIVSDLKTSNKYLNQLWQNIQWTLLDNLPGILTDCPQRDERAGWMGDAQVFAQTAIFNMNLEAFYKKWFRDIRDEQTIDGRFSNYAPYITPSLRYYDAPGWADAGVIIPWKAYVNYGDKNILRANFEPMRKFIDNVFANNPDLIRVKEVGQNYGDWLNGNTIKASDYPKEGGAIPKEVFSTAYFAYSAAILAKTCNILNEKKLFKHYDSLATAIKAVFVKKFMDDSGIIKGNTQAGYAMALEFDLIPENLRKKVVQNMANSVKAYDYRISTGIHTTERLMNQLSNNGLNDIAYRLIESHGFPSWLYSVDQGATTIWERWDGYVKGRGFQDPDMNSFNHYALGAVGEWMMRHILGINPDENNPGYSHFFIEPKPGGTLDWANGYYHSVAGRIGVSWKRENTHNTWEVEIPVNTTATLVLPTVGKIMESGKDIKRTTGIKVKKRENGKTFLLLHSGKYVFDF